MAANGLNVMRERAQPNLSPYRAAIKSDPSLHSGEFSVNQKYTRSKIVGSNREPVSQQEGGAYSSPPTQLPFAASSNLVNFPRKTNGMLSTGPFLCLAIFSSV